MNKCLYGADFSNKSWYDTLGFFPTNKLSCLRSRVDRSLYVYRKGNNWVKLINYVGDAIYDKSSDKVREDFELSIKRDLIHPYLVRQKVFENKDNPKLGFHITQPRSICEEHHLQI